MKAMLLAAGRGTRMGELTRDTPKPLLAVEGEPLIGRLVRSLAQAGFTDLVVNLAYLGGQIEAVLGDGNSHGASILYSWESKGALGTGGGIHHALPLLGEGPFLVVNADILTDFPFAKLRRPPTGLAHLVLVDNPDHNPAGDFALYGDGVVSNAGEPRLTFAGIGVYRPELLADWVPGVFSLAPVLRTAADQRQVTGERYAGHWLDVGTPARLRAARTVP